MGDPTLVPEDPVALAPSWVARLLERRLVAEPGDQAAAARAAQVRLERVLPTARGYRLRTDGVDRGHVLVAPERDALAVVDLGVGVGSAVTVRELVERLARDDGYARLTVGAVPADPVTAAFIEEAGFTVAATQMRLDLGAHLPSEDRVRLGAMTEAELARWESGQVESYAVDLETTGQSAEVAEESARTQLTELLPEGRSSTDAHFLVGRHDDVEVGSLWLSTSRPMVYVYDVLVPEEARGQGYGAAMMRAAAVWARERGSHAVGLNVFGHNRVARSLYDRLGYLVVEDYCVKELG